MRIGIMAKKYGITNPKGNGTRKGSTKAEEKATQAADKRARERLKERFKDVGEKVSETAQNVAGTVQNVVGAAQTIGNAAKSLQNAATGGSTLIATPSTEAYKQALQMGEKYGIKELPVQEMLGTDPYKADGNIPEMSAKDANAERLKIQRQNNALNVRKDKIAQGRLVVATATENVRLVGDVVTYNTAQIEVGAKVVQNQIAESKFRTEQSKLEQTEEFLTQQQIRTQGTINLTQGIREEQDLRFQEQQAKNDNLKLSVEGAIKDNEIKRLELEAKLLDF